VTPREPEEKPIFKQFFDASAVGIQFVLCTFAGFAIGYFLDKTFKTSPWLTGIFLLLGIVAGFRELLRVARKQNGAHKEDH
jgi:ATP synthase protein I